MPRELTSEIPTDKWSRILVEQSPSALIVLSASGRVVMLSRHAARLLRTSETSASGQPAENVLKLTNPATGKPLKLPPSLFRHKSKLRPFRAVVATTVTGKDLPVVVVPAAIESPKGKFLGVTIELREAPSAPADETHAASPDMAAIGSMASTISHNLGNWLSVIAGHASAITDNVLPNTRAHDEAGKIIAATKHAGDLTRRLLSISRASTRGASATKQIAVTDALKQAIEMAEGALAGKSVNINFKGAGVTSFATVNQEQLIDCLINIFTNAAESMPSGGTIHARVGHAVEHGKHFVVISVRDSGCGIPRENIDRIFDPLFTTRDNGTAMGLGLTIVKRSVEQWGGSVKVWSRTGHGSIFRMFLPRSSSKTARESGRSSSHVGGRILVVDDDINTLNVVGQALTGAGYTVIPVTSTDGALTTFRKSGKSIDLSIVDLVMPVTDGKPVVGDILDADPSALVIVTSGFPREYVRSYLDKGAWSFVQKPLDCTQLLATVKRLLDEKRAGEKAHQTTPAAS